jgi:uncharacterized protein (TIGR01244 family)
VSNYRQTDGVFFIGPQPTAQDLQDAKRQGIKTVIDFRMPSETAESNAKLTTENDLRYVNIPVNKAALSLQQIGKLDEALKENEGPYLLHCATGTRAAMILALSRARQHGWTVQQAFEESDRLGYDLRASPEFSKFVTEAVDK